MQRNNQRKLKQFFCPGDGILQLRILREADQVNRPNQFINKNRAWKDPDKLTWLRTIIMIVLVSANMKHHVKRNNVVTTHQSGNYTEQNEASAE